MITQPALPVVALVNLRSADTSVRLANAFRKGLDETGYVEGQNVTVEYHWLDGRFDQLSSVMADLVRRRVTVIATNSVMPTQRYRLRIVRLTYRGKSLRVPWGIHWDKRRALPAYAEDFCQSLAAYIREVSPISRSDAPKARGGRTRGTVTTRRISNASEGAKSSTR
jgi:hypothetical protein